VTGFGVRQRRRIAALMVLMAGFSATAPAQTACPDGHAAYGDIGVGLYQCIRANCLFAGRNSEDSAHVFNVEPTLWYLTGSARSVLRDGDALAAIDGHPITTRAGGARLATVRPGERVSLIVRREGTQRTVAIVAIASCTRPTIQITSSDGGPPADVTRKALSGLAVPRAGTVDADDLAAVARVIGIVSSSIVIDSVVVGSTAAVLGLQRGDVVLSIARGPDGPMTILIRRGGRLLHLTAKPFI
jgi:S1-C subfamily serine protease